MDNFLPDQLNEIKTVFANYDINGDGYIHAQYLGTILRILHQDPTKAQLKDLEATYARPLDNLNTSTKVIDFPELITILSQEFSYGSTSQNQLKTAFKVLDKENTGFIDASDLKHTLTTFGDVVSWDIVDKLLEKAGLPLEGMIPYEKIIHQLTEVIKRSSISVNLIETH